MPHSRGLFIKCKYNHNLIQVDKKYHQLVPRPFPLVSKFPDLTTGWARDPCQVSCILCSVHYSTDTQVNKTLYKVHKINIIRSTLEFTVMC